jgi:hypothetical protein
MTAKPVYKSKTMIFNAATFLAFIVAILNTPEVLELVKLLPTQYQEVALLIIPALVTAVNIWLRLVTKQPVTLKS